MNNNSKRKNRPSGVTRFSSDNRTPKGRPPPQGVYNNTYFMHAATALVGNVVQVRLRSGNIYEGVFRTFSPNFDVALELPLCIKSSKNAPDEGKSVPNYMIFPYDNVVSISAKDFDSQYATVGSTFQTDGAISEKCNGTRFDEKELEPWDASGINGEVDIELDGASNGWDANEMFKKNENAFGVQSTFDDSLSDYTVQLANKDSDEFKEAEMKAEKLAAEIENNPVCRERLDLENGDEEALFAAVERPATDMEREREREYERERENEREREREHDRNVRDREQREREREREVVSERYITKPQRNSAVGPSPIVATSAVSTMTVTGPGGAPSGQGILPHSQRENMAERSERVINTAALPAAVVATMGQSGNPSTATSSASISGSGMKSSAPQSSNMNAPPPDNSNKYVPAIKRKSMPQNNKMVRNTPPPNSAGGSTMSQTSGNTNVSGGGGAGNPHGSKGYQSMPMQNSNSYSQNYSGMVHGPSQYNRHQSNMSSGATKQNGDSMASNTGKPMQQRNMRQYQSSQSGAYGGDSQHQMQMSKSMHVSHGPQHGPPPSQTNVGGNNSSSPPLQSSASQHAAHSQSSPGSMHAGGAAVMSTGAPNQAPPQPQRIMRTRDTQLQDLRQFGQDFQLAAGNAPPTQQQHQQHQQQQQQQQQQQHMQMTKNSGGHNPQPAVSPPQQQQQQHVTQHQQQHVTQHQQQHVVIQHVAATAQQHVQQQQHHVQSTQHQQQQSTHSHQAAPPPPQQHYLVQQAQQHVQQQKQQQQQQHVDNANMMHIAKAQSHGMSAQQQVQQQQLQQHQHQMEQPMYHAATMTAPAIQQQQPSPVMLTSPVVESAQHQPTAAQLQLQQQQSLSTMGSMAQSSSSNSNNNNNNNTNKSMLDSASVNSNNNNPNTVTGEKTMPSTGIPKKTHVLNPSAKPFTPRSPSTPNPSRPHTPQTPVPMAGIYTTSSQLATNQTQIYAVMQQPTAFQTPLHPQAAQQPRLRRGNYGPMTASQMHVSATAATGQPLLATAPIQQIIYHQQAAHPTHFPSQQYTPIPLQFLTQTPPSTTPSPGQPHQTFHPPPQPSPAGGGQPTFAPQTQPQPAYHTIMSYPMLHPSQLVPNHQYYQAAPQHPQQNQQFQIVMQQHPNQ